MFFIEGLNYINYINNLPSHVRMVPQNRMFIWYHMFRKHNGKGPEWSGTSRTGRLGSPPSFPSHVQKMKTKKEIREEIEKLDLKFMWLNTRGSFAERLRLPEPKEPEPELKWLELSQTLEGVEGAEKALKWVLEDSEEKEEDEKKTNRPR